MSVKVIYEDVAVGAAEDASVSVNVSTTHTNVALLPSGGSEKDTATVERSLWILDGSKEILDDDVYGLWSAYFSNASTGLFSTAPVVTIAFTEQYTSLGVTINFGGDTWASSVLVEWYQSGTLLDSETYTPDSMNYFCEKTVTAYDQLVLTFYGTKIPYRRLKVNQILFGIERIFERDELRKTNAVLEIDPVSRELAANELDFTLSSQDDVDYMFQWKQPVYAYDGDNLIGTFYITSSDRKGPRLYDVSCTDAIGVLESETWPDARYTGTNAYTLAQSICAPFTVEMDTALQSQTVRGVLVGCTKRTALQQLCFALGAVADTSGGETIRIFALPTTPTVIPESRTREGGTVKSSDLVTAVSLTAHSYSTSGSGESVIINGTTYYDTQTVTTITNPNVTASDKPNVVEITDATLISPTNVATIAQLLYDYYLNRQTHNLSFRLDGESVGDRLTTTTPWGTNLTGVFKKANITLSGFALAKAEVVAT